MLMAGGADAWFSDPNFAECALRGTPHLDRLIFGPPIVEKSLYIAGAKNLSPQLIQAYRNIFEEIKAEGLKKNRIHPESDSVWG